jgi:hypothetical protein
MDPGGQQDHDGSAPAVACSFCGRRGNPKLCSACKVTAYCDRSCQANARKDHKDLCVKISKQTKVVTGMEEDLAKNLGGREAFERARGTLDTVADARSYLNAQRNLGLLYRMMSEMDGSPDAILVAEKRCVLNQMKNICLLIVRTSDLPLTISTQSV